MGWPRAKENWWEQQSASRTWHSSSFFPMREAASSQNSPCGDGSCGTSQAHTKLPFLSIYPRYLQAGRHSEEPEWIPRSWQHGWAWISHLPALPEFIQREKTPSDSIPGINQPMCCGGCSPCVFLPLAVPSLAFQGQQKPLAVLEFSVP